MARTIAEIAEMIGGELEGDGSAVIEGLAGISDARPGTITFLSNPRYAPAAANTKASAVIAGRNWAGACPCAVIRVENPDASFAKVAQLFAPEPPPVERGVHPSAIVDRDAFLGAEVSIGAHTVVEPGASIGDRTVVRSGCHIGYRAAIGSDCLLHPNVSVRERVRIGNRAIIHNGAVIGSDGFGYAREGGRWTKIPQIGTVVIGDDVEIGANTTIDRARFGETVIGNGVKIDNLVQVAHNVRIGDNTAIAAQVGIAGSTTVGKNVQLGGQAGVSGHLEIGDNAVAGGQAGVTHDVPPDTFVSGYPAMAHDKARRIHAHLMHLPDLRKKVDELEKRLRKEQAATL